MLCLTPTTHCLGLVIANMFPLLRLYEDVLAGDSPDAKIEDRVFSENDMLASLISSATHADLLVLLTDVDGVYAEHPTGARGALIPEITGTVGEIGLNEQVSELSRGGIRAKLHAAARAIESTRLFAVIANGRTPEVLEQIVRGNQIGTLIAPAEVL